MLSPGDPSAVLVTVPAYNERLNLGRTIEGLWRSLPRLGLPFRLSVAEDGSTDGTQELVKGLQHDYPELLVRSEAERRGRGYALREFWRHADFDIYAFIDADMPAGPEALLEVIEAVRNGADVATGSRYCPGARVHRPPVRSFTSQAYNWLVRSTFRDGIYDHQCGLKAFSRHAVETLDGKWRENSWFWDTEVLVLAQRLGLSVAEVPIDWTERRYDRTPMRRLVKDVWLHSSGWMRLVGRLGPSSFPEESPAPSSAASSS